MFKKIFHKTVLFSLVILFLSLNYSALAIENPFSKLKNKCLKESTSGTEIVNYSISPKLEKNIKESIKAVYGKDQVNVIYPRILKIIKKARENRPLKLYMDDASRSSDWYKDEIIYMFYVDQFGVKDKNSTNTFKDDIKMLDYLKDLGITTIYMLPFMDSPMGDAGFDVRDPENVRKDLGGMREFKEFVAEARKRGFKINADLILNHFSDQHKWFQEALNGDLSKINYFVSRTKLPKYNKYFDKKLGMVVAYKEDNGEISKRRLIFPDASKNHFRKVTIKGKDYYFYHTFYPFQLDVNWKNPNVLYYMLNVLSFWSNIGIDIFRMDAIPYYIKKKGTNAENLPETHELIKLLSSFEQAISPRSVMQAEAGQRPKDILPYFGKEETIDKTILCNNKKKLTRTDQVQIAYNFPFMPAIWASLITHDNSHFWKAYDETPKIPKTTAWALFLRVHDELTLEMVDVKTRKLIYDNLVKKGAEFRKGLGVSGRMANFLDNNPDRIGLAFSILMSMRGIPIIYYGDEIGAQNNWRYAKESEAKREKMAKEKGTGKDIISFFDSRDINRGPITKEAFYSAEKDKNSFSGQLYQKVKELIHLRKENPVMTRGDFLRLKTNKAEIFTYLRKNDSKQMIIVNNLSGNSITAEIKETVKKIKKQKELKDLISGNEVDLHKISANTYQLNLKPYQSMWIKL